MDEQVATSTATAVDDKENQAPTDGKGWQEYWTKEFGACKDGFDKFQKRGKRIVSKYLDTRDTDDADGQGSNITRLNLFHANITTLRSMLYGRIPKVEVDRRFADASDDPARVASVILQRVLNTDIQNAGEKYSYVVRTALEDRLIVGLGEARCRYQFTKEPVPAKTGPDGAELAPAYEKIKDEWVEEIYTHWQDVKWSPCRIYTEMRWKAYREYLCKDELIKRFGEKARKVQLKSKGAVQNATENSGVDKNAQAQAEVWEIWDKEHKKVFWFVEGEEEILEEKGDILELEDFWPGPSPMMANVTSSKLMPRADYTIAQDLYNAIDELETRITILTDAIKVIGVYDKNAEGVQRMIQEGVETDLIPVDNWAMFAEKGGIKGVIDWFPIEQVVDAVMQLTTKQEQKIAQLYQITGMSDIIRGQAAETGVSATEQSLKAKFASIRVQALQDEFARFASDMQNIKAEIMARHFQPETIIRQSNILSTPDGQNMELVVAAVTLIKNPMESRFRVIVRPETLAMADYAQMKQDRSEFLTGMATFLQSSAPILEMAPEAMPFLLEMLKWGLAGFKGSNEIEGVVDQMIQKASQPKPEKPDPNAAKMQMEMQKMQMEMQMAREDHQQDLMLAQQKMKNEMMMTQFKMQLAGQQSAEKLQQIQTEFALKMEQQQQEFALEQQQLRERLRAERTEFLMGLQHQQIEHQQSIQHEAVSGELKLKQQKAAAKIKPKNAAGRAH